MNVCLCVWRCTMWIPVLSEESVGSYATGARDGCKPSWDLGRSSTRATCAHNHRAISPAPK